MSGPDYPRTQITTIDSADDVFPPNQFDVWNTIASQYANSPIITSMIEQFSDALSPYSLFEEFYSKIWNIETAEGYGLDIWGRIVGIERTLSIPTVRYFGFGEAGDVLSFGAYAGDNTAGSFSKGVVQTENYVMADSLYRRAILAKAATNITDGTIKSINAIMMVLFPNRGNAYILERTSTPQYLGFEESTTAQSFGTGTFYTGSSDLGAMKITYVFDFAMTKAEIMLVKKTDVLPRPAGVTVTISAHQ